LWTRWNFDPILLGILLITACAGAVTLRSAAASRQRSFFAAWLAAGVLFVSPCAP
jgi:putative membrane protein